MALDATVGGASANSYVTVAEADAYFADRPFSETWSGLSAGEKEASLITATRTIEAKITEDWSKKELPQDATIRVLSDLKGDTECYLVWKGIPATTTQALGFPRSGLTNARGGDLADDVIPNQLKDFQCEVALKVAAEDRTLENAATAQGLSTLTAGPVTLGWKDGAPNPQLIPNALFKILPPSWWYAFELKYQIKAMVQVI